MAVEARERRPDVMIVDQSVYRFGAQYVLPIEEWLALRCRCWSCNLLLRHVNVIASSEPNTPSPFYRDTPARTWDSPPPALRYGRDGEASPRLARGRCRRPAAGLVSGEQGGVLQSYGGGLRRDRVDPENLRERERVSSGLGETTLVPV